MKMGFLTSISFQHGNTCQGVRVYVKSPASMCLVLNEADDPHRVVDVLVTIRYNLEHMHGKAQSDDHSVILKVHNILATRRRMRQVNSRRSIVDFMPYRLWKPGGVA
jgi:hypothetical protein